MSPQLSLAGQACTELEAFGFRAGGPCRWMKVRCEESGTLGLLQAWQPLPPERDLHHYKELHLQRMLEADPLDPPEARFGFDPEGAWMLQVLSGIPLARLWPGWGGARRRAFLDRLKEALAASPHPRFLHPAVVCLEAGRIRVPRVFGETPTTLDEFRASLEDLDEETLAEGEPAALWLEAPEIPDEPALPIRGRSPELTYLKSLMVGLGAPTPMERIMVLQGEEGLGHGRLAEWAAAAAETEGLWVHRFQLRVEEGAGDFLARLLMALLQGFEAEFYARNPEAARALAARLPTFGFLRTARRGADPAPDPEAPELAAALEVLGFAAEVHRRLIQVIGLESASIPLQSLLAALVKPSGLPWFLSAAAPGAAGTLLGSLKGDPAVAFMNLGRIEDYPLREVAEDVLGHHWVPGSFLQEACAASLGNPGLLLRILELSRLDGALVWEGGHWACPAAARPSVHLEADRYQRILAGRIQRLGPACSAIVRILALSEEPLDLAVLGSALGIAGDPLEDAVRGALQAKLIRLEEGRAWPADGRIREALRAAIPAGETRRLARALLRALEGAGFPAIHSVRLQSLAYDPHHALTQLLKGADEPPPAPLEAQRVVEQALALGPDPGQEARLWEFLSDAWCRGLNARRIPDPLPEGDSPWQRALAALDHALEVPVPDLDPQARMLRKRAFLAIRVRDFAQAEASLTRAASVLTGHPLHPEQARLRLALGLLHRQQGHLNKAVGAFEEGLQLLTQSPRPTPSDQVALLIELGRIHGQRGQFQRALATLQSAQRLLEHGLDFPPLVGLLEATAQIQMVQGHPEAAYGSLREALQAARNLEDLELQAGVHLLLGLLRSWEQSLGPALRHLEAALECGLRLGDSVIATRARGWKARSLAALGDAVGAEHALLGALAVPPSRLSVEERGDFEFLQGEIAQFRGAWSDAERLFGRAAESFGAAGLLWRERLARLRGVQVEAQRLLAGGAGATPENAWTQLERLKTLVEGSGSRWLELEWHRGHALLLDATGTGSATLVDQSLAAWGEVLGLARDLGFRLWVLEAATRSALLLAGQGERLGARARMQDTAGCFQDLMLRTPEAHRDTFLGREELRRYRSTLEGLGLAFQVPERSDPLADWVPAQAPLPRAGRIRGSR